MGSLFQRICRWKFYKSQWAVGSVKFGVSFLSVLTECAFESLVPKHSIFQNKKKSIEPFKHFNLKHFSQANSISNYNLRLNGPAFQKREFTNVAILRAQSLSINGGSRAIKLHLKDHKTLYEQDIELGRRPSADYKDYYDNDNYVYNAQPIKN